MVGKQKAKTFLCVPISLGLPCIFLVASALHFIMALWLLQKVEIAVTLLLCTFSFFSLFMVIFTGMKSVWRVNILQKCIICKGLLPHNTFSLEYEKCTIGMDWHSQNGNRIWWIYLCYGRKPVYKSNNPNKRMNTLKCQPGFIRIMYSDAVYEALMDVLPKKQKIGLETSRRYACFEKQGKII